MLNGNLNKSGVDHISESVPDHVQIQTVTGCNANCVFCPNGKTSRSIPKGRRMAWDLYRSVVDQSIAFGIRRYSVYLMNEPLLDHDDPDLGVVITGTIDWTMPEDKIRALQDIRNRVNENLPWRIDQLIGRTLE